MKITTNSQINQYGLNSSNKTTTYYPFYGWIGICLIIIFWILNWSLSDLRTHWGFFPLWLGYCLTIDALVYKRKKTSLIKRNFKAYIALFIISAPAWWLFELINWRTQNWFYMARDSFSTLEYFLYASLNFSTVIPAVFGTSELAGTFKWIRCLKKGPLISTKNSTLFLLFFVGWIMLALLIIWPKYFFPCVWMSMYFILDPINVWLKSKSLIHFTNKRRWQPVMALWTGCLICGFFWEMWNFYSYPKWIYKVPYVDFLHIFEMPALGYLGYLPFALELYALYHLIIRIIAPKSMRNYISII